MVVQESKTCPFAAKVAEIGACFLRRNVLRRRQTRAIERGTPPRAQSCSGVTRRAFRGLPDRLGLLFDIFSPTRQARVRQLNIPRRQESGGEEGKRAASCPDTSPAVQPKSAEAFSLFFGARLGARRRFRRRPETDLKCFRKAAIGFVFLAPSR